MKRDRVYLSKPDRLPFAPDQASALTRLMAVLESSFDGIFITDGQATPLWCNHSYEIISGLTAADVLGIPMAQLVATGVISHSSTLKALNQGQAVTLEQTFTTGKQAVVTSTPIYDQDDNVCLVVTTVRDISELTALQETLDHQRRLSAKYRQEMSVIRAQLMTTPQLGAEDPATLNLLRIVSRAAQLDQAPAGPPGERDHPRGRQQADERRCARHRRHQPGPAKMRHRGDLPRGPLLSSQRFSRLGAPSAPAEAGHPQAGPVRH